MSVLSIWNLILIFVLIGVNAFFVSAEIVFVKLRPSQVEKFIQEKRRGAKYIKKITQNMDQTLAATQLGITMASIALGFVGEPYFIDLIIDVIGKIQSLIGIKFAISVDFIHGIAFVLSYTIVAYMHVTLGELIPKMITIKYAEQASTLFAWPMMTFIRASSIFLRFFMWSAATFLNLFKISVNMEDTPDVNENEIRIILEEAQKKKVISYFQKEIIYNILDFDDINAEMVQTPRNQVIFIDVNTDADKIIKISSDTGFSRFPVYEDEVDNLLGFIHIKDVLKILNNKSEFNLRDHLNKLIITHEKFKIDKLFREMQKEKIQMAVVINEFGSVEGIVTLEDLLESIFGPIRDEYDENEINEFVFSKTEDTIVVEGSLSIDEFNKKIRVIFNKEIESEGSVTLAGYILEKNDSMFPKVGDVIYDGKFYYKIKSTSGFKIKQVIVSVKDFTEKKKDKKVDNTHDNVEKVNKNLIHTELDTDIELDSDKPIDLLYNEPEKSPIVPELHEINETLKPLEKELTPYLTNNPGNDVKDEVNKDKKIIDDHILLDEEDELQYNKDS